MQNNSKKLSSDHHYIPQFYLRGFCRSDGTFDVYDKEHKKFKKSPQTPAKVFFEKNKNTIKFRGKKTDQIEVFYSTLESSFSQLFKLINSGENSLTTLNSDAISLLQKYIAIQFWRLPILDDFANNYILSRTKADIDHICTITNPPLLSDEIYKLIHTDVGFRHYFRCFVLPLSTFRLNNPTLESVEWKIFDVENADEWSNYLCTDAPIIFDSPEKLMSFSGSFILALSNSKLLIFRANANQKSSFDSIFSTKLSILLYLQAKKYVVCSNGLYLEEIIKLSEMYKTPDTFLNLKQEVLSYLD